MLNVVVMTMVYNDGSNLHRWMRHYQRHVKHLLVIDHGSDDGSTENIAPAERLRLPRSPFDDAARVNFVNDVQRYFLRHFDAVIYTDSDELIVPDPHVFTTITEYVSSMSSPFSRPVGFNIVHQREKEPALDPARPILSQRTAFEFRSPMCKPVIVREPTRWSEGFHASDKPVHADPALWLFHTKWADYEIAINRLRFTRNMAWSDHALTAGWGAHQRQSEEAHTRERFYEPNAALKKQGRLAYLPAHAEANRFNRELVLDESGFWVVPFFVGRIFASLPYMHDLI